MRPEVARGAKMLSWMHLTLSGAADHTLAPQIAWHGRLMVAGWSILLPTGILAARFFKVLPRQNWPERLDNRAWWHAHRWLNCAGLAAAALALFLILRRPAGAGALAFAHRAAGFAVLGLGVFQLLGGVLRGTKGGPTGERMRGDHFDMTPRRVRFERLHKSLGWLAMPLAALATVFGLVLADAPRWMAVLIAAWWLLLVAAFVALQKGGRCFDTYQAIWGPDPTLPGNQRKPIGWGIRRIPARHDHPGR